MSLDKSIEHGKEKRKPYRGAKAIDCTCRNHGSCEWCKRNRLFKFRDKLRCENGWWVMEFTYGEDLGEWCANHDFYERECEESYSYEDDEEGE